MLKSKVLIVLLSALLMLIMALSLVMAQPPPQFPPPGTKIPTYSILNVAPNPVGVGQTVTLAMFLSAPTQTSQYAEFFTIVETLPDGTSTTLGPFISDWTGGTATTIVPTVVGNYSFQMFYSGNQTLTLPVEDGGMAQYAGDILQASQSSVQHLTVQAAPIVHVYYPFTPLPTEWWQTPVPAENVQNWYTLTGPWLGFGSVSFASTGYYNLTTAYNPYTPDVLSSHIIWTKPWAAGGVVGGDLGGNEQDSSYWSTTQYQPKYAPVVMNGIIYSQQYTTNTGTNEGQGIQAIDLYNGQTLWTINTTNPLVFGMDETYHSVNQYGVLGPFIWTTGQLPAGDTGGHVIPTGYGLMSFFGFLFYAPLAQYNLYDAFTGQYILSVVNGSSLMVQPDAAGDIIGYFQNNTAGTQLIHPYSFVMGATGEVKAGSTVVSTQTGPHITMVNMTNSIEQFAYTEASWEPARDSVYAMQNGYEADWAIPTTINGVPMNPWYSLGGFGSGITGNALILTATAPDFSANNGWMSLCAMNCYTGAVLCNENITYDPTNAASFLPWTRQTNGIGDGIYFNVNNYDAAYDAWSVETGALLWKGTLTGYNGAPPDVYDNFAYHIDFANNRLLVYGLGGDIWALNLTTGARIWYTNTTTIFGPSGLETPYNVWPIWTFNDQCFSNNVCYYSLGHEYNPPLFHGAQVFALNQTTGKLIWSFLDFSGLSNEISYGVLVTLNMYDNQLYAQAKGPSDTTVTAPNIGVTTATPITISGSVMDVSPGTQQQLVKSNWPNGVPCVSDSSESGFMAAVYEQQVMPANVTGVPVTLTETDHNGNTYTIGTTRTDLSGTFAYAWTPPIVGNYTIVATFDGSNSYWGSCAETHIYAGAPAPTTAPTAPPITGLVSWSSFELGIALVVIILIVIGAVLAVLVMRKRP